MQLNWSKKPKQSNAAPEHVMLHPSVKSSSSSQLDESRSEQGVARPVHMGRGRPLDEATDVAEDEGVETLAAPPAPVDGVPVQAG
jgi:hypothetical protein